MPAGAAEHEKAERQARVDAYGKREKTGAESEEDCHHAIAFRLNTAEARQRKEPMMVPRPGPAEINPNPDAPSRKNVFGKHRQERHIGAAENIKDRRNDEKRQ